LFTSKLLKEIVIYANVFLNSAGLKVALQQNKTIIAKQIRPVV